MSKSFLFSIVFLIFISYSLIFCCFSHQFTQIHLGGFTHALRDNGPISEPQFYLTSFYPLPILSTVFIAFTLSLFFPPFLLLTPFFSILLCQSPSFFPLFFSSYVIFPYFFYCFFSSIYPDPPRRADQGGIVTPTSPNCHLVHNPKKNLPGPPFLPPIFLIFNRFGSLCPQTPLTHFVHKNNFA